MLRQRVHALISLFALVALCFFAGATTSSARQTSNKAGVVVQFPDGAAQTYCVEFQGESITGLDLLLKTGLDVKVEVQGLGALICSIGATGCDYPAQTCVCQSYGPNGVYWAYHHLQDGKWRTSVAGASTYQVKPGAVEGWAWGKGTPPPVIPIEQICQLATPPTSTPENTPIPTDPPLLLTPTNTLLPPTETAVVPHTSSPTTPPPPTNTKPIPPTPTPTYPMPPTPDTQPTSPPPTPTPPQPPTTEAPPATEPPTNTPSPPSSTPTSTVTIAPAATQMPTSLPTVLSTTQPSQTPTAPAVSSEDTARTIGYVIAGIVLVSLGIWGAFSMLRRTTPPTRGGSA